jgi:hypothetical protein
MMSGATPGKIVLLAMLVLLLIYLITVLFVLDKQIVLTIPIP